MPFTYSWWGRYLPFLAVLVVVGAGSVQTAASDLFISEYIEGSSNNKALEIYNGTGGPVDLATGGYDIQMYFNGNPSAGLTIALTGTVADGDVFVIAQSAASAPILAVADQTQGSGWFNGDDAVLLRKAGVVIDAIGQVGFDPGRSGVQAWRRQRTIPCAVRQASALGTPIPTMPSILLWNGMGMRRTLSMAWARILRPVVVGDANRHTGDQRARLRPAQHRHRRVCRAQECQWGSDEPA